MHSTKTIAAWVSIPCHPRSFQKEYDIVLDISTPLTIYIRFYTMYLRKPKCEAEVRCEISYLINSYDLPASYLERLPDTIATLVKAKNSSFVLVTPLLTMVEHARVLKRRSTFRVIV